MFQTFVKENEKIWDKSVGAMKYAYNTTVNPSIVVVPCELVLSKPPGSAVIRSEPVYEGKPPMKVCIQFVDVVKKIAEGASEKLMASQRRYKHNFDARIKPLEQAQVGY